jgi:phosphoglycerate dehydrogenase-like enzyme
VAKERKLILVTVNIPDTLMGGLTKEFPQYEFRRTASKDEAVSVAKDADIVVALSPSAEIISSAKKCKWLQVLTAGVEDYLAIGAVKNNQDLLLTNASGIHGIQISEHVFAMILALTRGIKTAILNQQNKTWVGLERMIKPPSMMELCDKTLVIAGLGNIGLETARKGKAFGMRAIGVKRDPWKRPKDPQYSNYVDEIHGMQDLAKIVSEGDFIVNTLPLTEETEAIFDSAIFSSTKNGAIFVNVGRGKTVVEKDLIEALKSGKLAGAGLDVFEEEPLPKDSVLWEMENVVVSPHISGWSAHYFERALDLFKQNLRRYTDGESLINLVDRKAGY